MPASANVNQKHFTDLSFAVSWYSDDCAALSRHTECPFTEHLTRISRTLYANYHSSNLIDHFPLEAIAHLTGTLFQQ
jgi:hypothetical protein